jgi:hypothetical protein
METGFEKSPEMFADGGIYAGYCWSYLAELNYKSQTLTLNFEIHRRFYTE